MNSPEILAIRLVCRFPKLPSEWSVNLHCYTLEKSLSYSKRVERCLQDKQRCADGGHPVAWPPGAWEAIAPHFCQDGARDFLTINEKIGMGMG